MARYFMFTQVYFHKTRVAFDIHLREAVKEILPGGHFPRPLGTELKEFLQWDDWKVLGLLAEGKGGNHGDRLRLRDHFRRVFYTPEVSGKEDLDRLAAVKDKLGGLLAAEETTAKNWYKIGSPEIPVLAEPKNGLVRPLSYYSNVVGNLKANNQVFLYADAADVSKARKIVDEVSNT